jgi:hypothetical protein
MAQGKKAKTRPMKRSVVFLTLLLASCLPRSAQPTATRVIVDYVPSLSSFQSSEECPDICWLGMHAGKTSADEAMHLIKGSDEIDQQFTRVFDNSIEAFWFPEKTHTLDSTASVIIKGDLVESIFIAPVKPFKVIDAIDLWGEPDEISIKLKEGQRNEVFTVYSLYYTQFNTVVVISPGSLTGPDPENFIYLIGINVEFGNDQRQPWLGYGQIKYYLPDSEIP